MKNRFLTTCLLAVIILGFNVPAMAQCPDNNFIVSSNSPVCQGSTLNLSASGGTAYSWSGPQGFSSSSSTPSISAISPAATGTYYVTITGTGGCQQLDSLVVGINLLPEANILPGGPITICAGDSVILSVGPPTIAHNGPIGTKASCDCPPGYVAVGFKDNSGGLLDQWQLACKQLNPDYTLDTNIVYTVKTAPSIGGLPNGTRIFGGDSVMVGIGAQSIDNGVYFNNLFCYGLPISQVLAYANNAASHWSLTINSRFFGEFAGQGPTDSIYVPDGTVITGLTLWNSQLYYTSTFSPDYKNLQSFFQTDSTVSRTSYLWSTGDTNFSIKVVNSGNYVVTVSNSNGCSNISAPDVVVSDSMPPMLVCSSNIFSYDPLVYFSVYDSSYCSYNVVSDPPSGSVFYPGTTTVNNVAVNSIGDSVFCSFTVTVIDTTPPVMACPDTIVAPLDPTGCGARVTINPPLATDNSLPLIGSEYFSYTGGVQTWTVPPYVYSISIQATGAGGSPDDFYFNNPGYGAYVQTTLNVTPGQVLYLTVGGTSPDGITGGFNGGGNASLDVDGYNGGAGGGQTNIGITGNPLTDTLVVVAGGGGAGINCGNDAGGNGGGPNGLPGLSCGAPDGGGATQTVGGSGLYNGSFMQGANGDPFSPHGGGGGGGGYYGGGAGVIGGGGGGSSYVTPVGSSNTAYYEGNNSGNGWININYQQNIVSVQTGGISSDSIFPFGNSTVTYTATDLSGNTASCSFTVQVVDTSAPVIQTPANITVGTIPGSCGATVNFNVTATGRCSATYPVVSNPPSGSSFPVGETTVTNTATSSTGNTSSSTFIVTVIDSNPPVINCQPDITVGCDPNTCTAVVAFNPPSATPFCPPIVTTFNYTGGVQPWTVPAGVSSIQIQAQGAAGSPDNAFDQQGGGGAIVQTTLAVTPGEVLYITIGGLSGGQAGGYNGGGSGSYDGYGDNGGGGGGQTNIGTTGNPLTDTLVVAAGGAGSGIDCNDDYGGYGGTPMGYYGIDCGNPDGLGGSLTAGGMGLNNGSYMQGGNGNPNTYSNNGGGGGGGYYGGGSGNYGGGGGGSSYVTPVGTSNTTYEVGSNFFQPGQVTFTYTPAPAISYIQTSGLPLGSAFPLGSSTVTYTATDILGNTTSCSYSVTVVDTSAPVFNSPGNITAGDVSDACGATVNFNVTASSNCSGSFPVVSNPPSGSFFPFGKTPVTNTAVNAVGDTSVNTFIVTVIDSNAPVISNCPSDITVSSDPNSCGAVVSFSPPTAATYCGVQTDTFNYNGNVQQWIVPAGVDSIQVQAIGAAGSPDNEYYQRGGAGALAQTTLAVTPGEVLYFTAGGYSGGQAGGYNGGGYGSSDIGGLLGGGGGGQTNVGTTGNPITDTLVVAAGGGGSGISCGDDYGGAGGDPNGYNGVYCTSYADGLGATQTAGGGGFVNPGSYMQGGNSDYYTGGGGGGGYYGGGAGEFGGGGGGSSYVTPVGTGNTSYTAGYNCCGAGQVIITYTPNVTLVQTNGLPSGSVFPIGTTGISYTATSALGVTSTCTFFVNVNETSGPTYATICQGSSYNFNGNILTQQGIYSDTLISSNLCDSLVTLELTVTPAPTSSLSQTICLGQSYSFNGMNLTGGGTYYDTLSAGGGCDSIVILNLTVNVASSSSFSQTICQGQSYTFNGKELTQSGNYNDTLATDAGCDSIVTLNLTVAPALTSSFSQSICAGDTFNFNGTSLAATGSYNDTLTSVGGCDSIVTLTLTVNPVTITTYTDTICAGFGLTFNGSLRTTTGIYYDTLTSSDGCDSIIIFNLTVNPPLTFSFSQNICAGDSFNFNGKNLTQTGNYSDTLRTWSLCDSIVTLTLTVNSAITTNLADTICSGFGITFNGQLRTQTGIYYDTLTSIAGCDSIVAFNLTVLGLTTTNLYDTICSGSSIMFNGQLRDTTGTYYNPLTSSHGCDSLVTLNLTVLPVYTTNLSDTICSGFGITFNGQLRTQTGIYYDTLTSTGGCDSIVVFNLTVLGLTTTNLYDTICSGSSVMFNGQPRDTTGTYYNPLTSSHGCDSLVTLNLTVLPVYRTNLSDTICSGFGITFNGQLRTQTGIYYDTLTSVGGCDSIIVFNLTVNPVDTSSFSQSICAGSAYSFGGNALTQTGSYNDTLTSVNGCDSIITLNLTVTPALASSFADTICGGGTYNFNGADLITAGSYTDTLTSMGGCDSIVTLNLTVTSIMRTSLYDTICSGSSVIFNGQQLDTAGTYYNPLFSSGGCDSLVVLNLTVLQFLTTNLTDTICAGFGITFNGQLRTQTGIYYDTLTSAGGCDSIVVFNLTVNPVSTTNITDTICQGVSYSFNGLNLTTSGIYSDTLTGTGGCDSIIILNLQVKSNTPPVINTSGTTAICPGGSVTLDAGSGYTAYAWNYQSNNSETLDVTQTGNYYCVVSIAGCQVSSDTVDVSVNPITVGFTTAVDNNSISFTNTSTNATSYLWNFGDGDTSTAQNPSHTYATAGSFTVILTAANNACTLMDTQMVTTGCHEAQINGQISGPADVCAGSFQTYSAQGNAYTSSYTWIASGNCEIISGQETNSITVEFLSNFNDGIVRVYARGCLGYGTESSLVVVNGVTPPGGITGPVNDVCGGSAQTYSVAPVDGTVSYNWLVNGALVTSGQGTDSIMVQFPESYDTVSVSIQTQSACGVSSPVTIGVISNLSIGNLIDSTTGYCGGSTGAVISIPEVPGANSYQWSTPTGIVIANGQGTPAITVNIGPAFTQGNVSVYAMNNCGNGPVKNFMISGNPEKPAKIIGPPLVCSDVEATDSVKQVPFVTSYTWTVPPGWIINGAANTNKVAYTPGQEGGNVTVTANNECGSSEALTTHIGALLCDKVGDITDTTGGILSEMKVFPNPFGGQFEVLFEAPAAINMHLRLYTIEGQLLRNINQETVAGTNHLFIDISDEAAGVYILEASFANETKVLRMIKE